mmetsp:Transcript_6993/g.22938  ORF Transcript_6993/g.22938 Transcript_6993/m.22938 type:complete len:314 (-) Transcript_6993:496-1437(-)
MAVSRSFTSSIVAMNLAEISEASAPCLSRSLSSWYTIFFCLAASERCPAISASRFLIMLRLSLTISTCRSVDWPSESRPSASWLISDARSARCCRSDSRSLRSSCTSRSRVCAADSSASTCFRTSSRASSTPLSFLVSASLDRVILATSCSFACTASSACLSLRSCSLFCSACSALASASALAASISRHSRASASATSRRAPSVSRCCRRIASSSANTLPAASTSACLRSAPSFPLRCSVCATSLASLAMRSRRRDSLSTSARRPLSSILVSEVFFEMSARSDSRSLIATRRSEICARSSEMCSTCASRSAAS